MTDAAAGPGFKSGLTSLVSATRLIFGTPSLWPLAAVPMLLFIALSAVTVGVAFWVVAPFFGSLVGSDEQWYMRLLQHGAMLVSGVIAAGLGVVIALLVTPPLSAPALERIVLVQERRIGAPPRSPLGLIAEFVCGLRAAALAVLITVPVLLALTAIALVVPAISPLTTAAKFLVTSLAVAWNLFDYPLTLRGVRMRQRLQLMRAYPAATLGFGLGFAVLFWIPCAGVALLPVGAAAATELVWRMYRHNPATLRVDTPNQ